jgi:tyrosyl-tRNA synthetase
VTPPSARLDLLGELAWRGLLYDHTERLGDALAAGSVTGYCGFDPTADSLHVGSLVQIMGLLHLQRAGHRPIVLLGGGTGLIGDPSGKSSERPLLGADQIAANTQAIRVQLERFLDFSGPRAARMHDNAEWLVSLHAIEFLRDVGKHFSINFMLAKDSVKTRLDAGISFTEFSYMLLQAYDFLELHRREGVTLQTGGSDQWGNITTGIELIKRTAGGEAHGLVLPLVTTASGTKFGKTEAGTVWLDPKRTSVYRFYQFWVNADDRDVSRYLRFFTLLSADEITALDTATRESPERREAQQMLALDVTTRVHGADAARVASEVSGILFGRGDPRALSPDALAALAAEIPSSTLEEEEGNGTASFDVLDAFVKAGLAPSKGAARRLLDQGGLSVNGRRLAPSDRALPRDEALAGRYYLLRKGAREYALLETRR